MVAGVGGGGEGGRQASWRAEDGKIQQLGGKAAAACQSIGGIDSGFRVWEDSTHTATSFLSAI